MRRTLTKITRSLAAAGGLACLCTGIALHAGVLDLEGGGRGQPITGIVNGQVQRVLDGDTIDVAIAGAIHRIRLSDIDAPEASHCKIKSEMACQLKGQPWAEESTQALQAMVEGKSIRLTCSNYDVKYSRSVCRIEVGGVDINLQQVKFGLAWFNEKYSKDRSIHQAELDARRLRLGLWSSSYAVAPWTWRQNCWKKGLCS